MINSIKLTEWQRKASVNYCSQEKYALYKRIFIVKINVGKSSNFIPMVK